VYRFRCRTHHRNSKSSARFQLALVGQRQLKASPVRSCHDAVFSPACVLAAPPCGGRVSCLFARRGYLNACSGNRLHGRNRCVRECEGTMELSERPRPGIVSVVPDSTARAPRAETSERTAGYDFHHPAVRRNVPPPTVVYARPVRWWSLDRPERLAAALRLRDQLQEDILRLGDGWIGVPSRSSNTEGSHRLRMHHGPPTPC
jgi:hypothetical protein